MAQRRTGQRTQRTDSNSTSEPAQRSAQGKSARRPAAAAPTPTASSSASRRGRAVSDRSNAARSGRNAAATSKGQLSPAEERRKQKKIKDLITKGVIAVVLVVMVLIGMALMPNPNMEIALRELAQAQTILKEMQSDIESGNLPSVTSAHEKLVAILSVPMLAMGTDDSAYYNDPTFADFPSALQAKEIMIAVADIMKGMPEAEQRKKALANVQRLRSRINDLANEEDLTILLAQIEAYRANPVDPDFPDSIMEEKYESYMSHVRGYQKTIGNEQARRDAVRAAADKEAAAAQAIASAQSAAADEQKLKAEMAAKRQARQDQDQSDREAARDPKIVAAEAAAQKEAERFEKMTNATILKESATLVARYQYNLALKAAERFKEEAGFDPKAASAGIQTSIDSNFEDMQGDVRQMSNDARLLFQADKHGPARKKIAEAITILDTVIANCGSMKEKRKIAEELLEIALARQRQVGG